MWAHQYNQEPNQVEVSLHRKPWTTDGPESNLYGLEPNFGCCTANFHQGWPKFTASLWMYSQDDGLVAALYSPSEVHTEVRGTPVHLVEETDYPFREICAHHRESGIADQLPVKAQNSGLGDKPTILINGKPVDAPQR